MTLWTPFVAGQRITAGKLNALVGEWTPYSPLWTNDAGTATTVGEGTLVGKYRRVGNTIEYRIMFEWGAGTTAGTADSNWHFSIQVPCLSGDGTTFWPGHMWVAHIDGSDYRRWTGACYIDPPTNTLSTLVYNGEYRYMDNNQFPTATSTTAAPGKVNVAVGSRINFWGSYEAAA